VSSTMGGWFVGGGNASSGGYADGGVTIDRVPTTWNVVVVAP